MAETYVYPYSISEAKHDGDVELWRTSYKENIACKKAIEQAIRDNYNGNRLNADTASEVIAEYGFNRVNWVLAATIQEKAHDGGFSEADKQWAKGFCIPDRQGSDRASSYTVVTHPAILNSFIKEARDAYDALGLYDASHCQDDKEHVDYEGKVLVLNPTLLKDKYKTPGDQLVLAQGGFGCSPTASGRKVFGIFLKDGEKCQYLRNDFLGVLKDELLLDWAKDKLNAMNAQNEIHTDGMTPSM